MSSPWSEPLGSLTTLAMDNTTTILPRSSSCQLSPAGSAFAAIISAFVGSVINGVTNGWFVAFMTGWIAWLAIFRVLLAGLYMLYRSVTDSWGPGLGPGSSAGANTAEMTGYEGGSSGNAPPSYHRVFAHDVENGNPQPHNAWQPIPDLHTMQAEQAQQYKANLKANLWPKAALVRLHRPQPLATAHPGMKTTGPFPNTITDLDRNVTVLGWFSLAYTAIWAPITQILFLLAQYSRHDNGGAKLVKGLTVAVSALPLGVDCRVRYADAMPWSWARRSVNLVTALSALLQGAICAVLLVTGVMDLLNPPEKEEDPNDPWAGFPSSSQPTIPVPAVVVPYLVFAVIWMLASFAMLPMKDGGRMGAGKKHWAGYILDVGMGLFAGVFLAAPAFALMSNATFATDSSGWGDLQEYLSCEKDVWRRFAAVVP
ncbi:uncharacterized protein C8A04DRAFT_28642 [Dichotomopilus funicola]|uniref:Uncharacterized protein n=1 Tax=Dichotomopilus funicola TaxID=1934379 RepID=A0AAN6V2R4_9PEZI|nr:hypothetical protein C8A04DRAFT_28642 [Dichotomopilus funicola]